MTPVVLYLLIVMQGRYDPPEVTPTNKLIECISKAKEINKSWGGRAYCVPVETGAKQ